jgi:hypothetical protein
MNSDEDNIYYESIPNPCGGGHIWRQQMKRPKLAIPFIDHARVNKIAHHTDMLLSILNQAFCKVDNLQNFYELLKEMQKPDNDMRKQAIKGTVDFHKFILSWETEILNLIKDLRRAQQQIIRLDGEDNHNEDA